MSAKQMDAVASFTYLVENAPEWKNKLDNLLVHTADKYQEFRAEYARIVHHAKPRKEKTASICSVHTIDDIQDAVDPKPTDERSSTIQPPNPTEISPLEAGNRYIYAQVSRKRKPGTSLRSGASGPAKFRSKQTVVIYYDAYVQEQLDALAKGFGASRNNLRKGKMAYTVSKGFQLPTLRRGFGGSATPSLDSVRSATLPKSMSKIPGSKETTPQTSPETSPIPAGEAWFIRADKELESCQNLCETAAHQFLRDGDCKIELDAAAQALGRVIELAKTSLDALKLELQTPEATEPPSTETKSTSESTHVSSSPTLSEKCSREYLNFSRKITPTMINGLEPVRQSRILSQPPPAPVTTMLPTPVTEIEVDDDSDGSSLEIDISKYRAGNPARRRIQV